MESVLIAFTVCLALAFLLSELCLRLGQPKVVGQIAAGLVLGLPFFSGVFTMEGRAFVSSLSDIGVVFLLMLVGAEMRVSELKKASKKAFTLATICYVIPLTAGYLFMRYALGYDSLTSLVVGICLAISAEAVTIDILMEYNLLKTQFGTVLMEAGMIDDVYGIISLAAVIDVVQGGGFGSLASMPVNFLSFLALAYVLGFMLLPKVARVVWREKSEAAVFSLAIIFGMIVVMISIGFGLSSVVGAFVAGIIIQLSIKNRTEEKEIDADLNVVTFGLIIPFFFIYTGLNMNVMGLTGHVWFIVAITAIALAGKMAGAFVMGAIYRMKIPERVLYGWGMNPRGAVELIIANIAKASGLIDEGMFTAIVAMAIISAILSPVMFRRSLLGVPHLRADAPKHNHHAL